MQHAVANPEKMDKHIMTETTILDAIEAGPQGPKVGAFFDFDGTIMNGFSLFQFLKRRFRSNRMSLKEIFGFTSGAVSYSLKQTDMEGTLHRASAAIQGSREDEFIALGKEVFEKDIAPAVYPEMVRIINAHRKAGHTVAITSSATPYQLEYAAEALGVPDIICTRLTVEDGIFTGTVEGDLCWGEGKAKAVKAYAAQHKIKLKNCYFYSDGSEDIPLLEAVGFPHPTNPDRELEDTAWRRGWPVHEYSSRLKPDAGGLFRNWLAYSSLASSVAWSGPLGLLMGTTRKSINMLLPAWADFASAVARLNLHVESEHHLWEVRPALFLFNHQSILDFLILTKLLRRDFTGVAKKELKTNPLIGSILQLGDAIFVDRSDTQGSINALAPVAEALANGLSIVIAPEGTRSQYGTLLPFKKGPFHLAIDHRVPIVPVVLHNSWDALPKGGLLMQPADIRITVLPPVQTTDWNKKDINKHIADIRSLFLKALGQEDTRKD